MVEHMSDSRCSPRCQAAPAAACDRCAPAAAAAELRGADPQLRSVPSTIQLLTQHRCSSRNQLKRADRGDAHEAGAAEGAAAGVGDPLRTSTHTASTTAMV